MVDDFIVAGVTHIGEAIKRLKDGETVLVSPPYLNPLVLKAAEEGLELQVTDGGMFYYAEVKSDRD